MTELDVPIKRSLQEPYVPVDRLWSQIEAKRARGAAPAWLRIGGFAGALGAAFVVAALAVMHWAPRPESPAAGPLRRANGDVLGVLDTSQGRAALDVALSDGSRIRLEPGSKLVTQRSDGQQFRATLQRGVSVFEVKPGGPRRWTIEAGDARVEVIGTRFRVSNGPGLVEVTVERGRVEVRGPQVPQGVQSLGANERLVMSPPPKAASASEPRATRAVLAAEAEATPAAQGGGATGLADREALLGEGARAGGSLRDPVEPSAEALLRAADAARAVGDYRRAARTLQRFLAVHPADAQAAIVAITLGRIQLEHLDAPKLAVASFARAERLGLPDAVAEEGAARLVEAYARSGAKEKARAAAAHYARRFPDGARSESVAAWLDLP